MTKPRIRIIDNVYYIVRTTKKGEVVNPVAYLDGQPVLDDNGQPIDIAQHRARKAVITRAINNPPKPKPIKVANPKVAKAIKTAPDVSGLSESLALSKQARFVADDYRNIGLIPNPSLALQMFAVSIDVRALKHFPKGQPIDETVQTLVMKKDPEYAKYIRLHGPVCDLAILTQLNRDVSSIQYATSNPSEDVTAIAVVKFEKMMNHFDADSESAKRKLRRMCTTIPKLYSYLSPAMKDRWQAFIADLIETTDESVARMVFNCVPASSDKIADDRTGNAIRFYLTMKFPSLLTSDEEKAA